MNLKNLGLDSSFSISICFFRIKKKGKLSTSEKINVKNDWICFEIG